MGYPPTRNDAVDVLALYLVSRWTRNFTDTGYNSVAKPALLIVRSARTTIRATFRYVLQNFCLLFSLSPSLSVFPLFCSKICFFPLPYFCLSLPISARDLHLLPCLFLRREREAQELASSVAVGAAGVEDGLRSIDDACGGNPAEKKAAVQALQQASKAGRHLRVKRT